jgi:hypothetical protein
MRCDQCQHWAPPEEWEAKAAGFRRCLGVRERWKIEESVSSEKYDHDREVAALRAARAYVEDGSEYMAQMMTAPDFFCALYVSN